MKPYTIYKRHKETRPVRDLLRKRSQLVQQRTSQILSIQNLYIRNSGVSSNGKKKGVGNTKNGNRYLAWSFVEAANFAIRYHDPAKRFYQRKMAKTNRVVAIKALSHKLARASYTVMRDQVPFDPAKIYR